MRNFFKHHISLFILVLLIVIALAVRLYHIDKIPPGPDWDEASSVYNAFSITTTGMDEWQQKFPLSFPAFGDYKNALHIYFIAIAVKLFGLNLFSNRIVAVIIGSLLVIVWYFIAYAISENRKISLITSLFITFSPYGIFFSRIGDDGFMLSSFFISLGLLLEILFIKKRRNFLFILCSVFLILAIFSYDLARIVSPGLLGTIFIINYFILKTDKKAFLIPLILSIATALVIFNSSNIGAFTSLNYTGVFGEKKGVVLDINEFRDDEKNSFLSHLLYNKATFFGIILTRNYIAHFGTDFLANFKEQSIVAESFYPPLYLIMLPFYYWGLFLLFDSLRKKEGRLVRILLVILILIAPVPSTITEGAPSAHRYLGSFGTHEFLTAFGLYEVYKMILLQKGRRYSDSFISAFFVIYIYSLYLFASFFFITYPRVYGKIYASTESLIGNTVKNNYNNYDYFIYSKKLTLFPYIYPLYYLQFPLQRYWSTRQYHQTPDGWYHVDSFDKFIFPDKLDDALFADQRLKNKKVALFLNDEEINNIDVVLKKARERNYKIQKFKNKVVSHSGKKTLYLITLTP